MSGAKKTFLLLCHMCVAIEAVIKKCNGPCVAIVPVFSLFSKTNEKYINLL